MLNNLTLKKDIRTFSVCPENPTGMKGEGGRATLEKGSARHAARELGVGWKVNPYIVLNAGETAVLADIKGEGAKRKRYPPTVFIFTHNSDVSILCRIRRSIRFLMESRATVFTLEPISIGA